MLIRRERPADIAGIAAVHRSAFADPAVPDPVEVGLVDALRGGDAWIPTLSLVAVEHGAVIGHTCLTRAAVGPFPVLALGPLGVLRERQRAGVGAALVHAALGAADALDEPLIGLLGSLDYYPRFGFAPGARYGIAPDKPEWATHFQVRPLSAFEDRIAGDFRYADAFYEL
ncbi:GNAT family N-acetyltransferase [Nocardia sp. NPDC057353]|uniref:GNAT family N-acetyltransferase n=1 Tax=Nocardia sp. NPDC057353 TaxID=3346104 RepID=UPI00363D9798